MGDKTHNPERRAWKGRSYRKSGKGLTVRELREKGERDDGKPAKRAKLVPPDPKRCQAEKRSFMTLGPGRNRCENVPVVIASERESGPDGRRGSMSLCAECRAVLVEMKGEGYAQFTPIRRRHK